MEFEERESEPVLLFMAAASRAGAWNFHLYKTFADPFTTPGLVSDPSMHDGFVFEVRDLVARRRALFRTPEESYGLLACIGAPSRYVVEHVFSKEGAIAASTSIPGPKPVAGRRGQYGPPGHDRPVGVGVPRCRRVPGSVRDAVPRRGRAPRCPPRAPRAGRGSATRAAPSPTARRARPASGSRSATAG